ncbi:MAG: Lrp/AsnC family transcriptional regulator [Chthonomonas sp.]|nr:Lrp/AsnC family transcriptional regulator [Chthonomonas sp.]
MNLVSRDGNLKSKIKLDETDVAILRLLQSDGRITNADLARKVQLSPPSILQRVRRLEDAGLVDKYVAILSARRLGYHITVYAQISLQLHQDQPIEAFRDSVASIPQIMECYHVSGEFDFLLKILVEDMSAYEALVREKLSTIKGVGKIQSCFVLGTAKHTTEVSL